MSHIDFSLFLPQTAATQLRASEFLPAEGTIWPSFFAKKTYKHRDKLANERALIECAANFGTVG